MAKQTPEERLQKIKKMLSEKNGNIDDELKQEVQSFTKEKKDAQVKNITNTNSISYNSEEAIANLANIEPPDIVKESIKKTLSSMLDPLRTTFITEMSRYSDAISIEEKTTKKIRRGVRAKKIKKIENGKFVPSVTGEDGEKFVVNPEFKQLLSTGYKPTDDREYQAALKEFNLLPSNPDNPGDKNPFFNLLVGINKPQIGTPESEYIKNYVDGDAPAFREETVPITINNTAGIFKKSFSDLTDNVKFNSNKLFKEITLNGYSVEASETNKFKAANTQNISAPNWKISYKEADTKYHLNIDNNIEYFTGNKTSENTSSYYFVGHLGSSSLSQQAIELLNSINPSECNVLDNKELYVELMTRDADRTIFSNTDKQALKIHFSQKYDDILYSFINTFFSSYKNDRLLKPFKMQKIPGLESGDLGASSNLIILNLLNFIPQVSEELIACGKQPHPLNLDLILDLMSKKFSSIGVQIIPKKDFCNPSSNEEPPNPIAEAAGVGVAIAYVRLCIFETILKSLFVLDEHQYSFDVFDTGLLTDYVYVKTLQELEQNNFLEDVQNIIEENYQFLKDNLTITEQDEKDDSSVEKIVLNKVNFTNNSPEMKKVIKHLIRRNLGFLRNLIGVSQTQNTNNLLLEKMSNKKIYDVINDQILDFTTSAEENRNSSEKYSRRFADIQETEFMCLEKYVEIDTVFPFKYSSFSSVVEGNRVTKKYEYISGKVNFNVYQQFLNDFIADSSIILPNTVPLISGSVALTKMEYFLNKIKFGLRLVQNWNIGPLNLLTVRNSEEQSIQRDSSWNSVRKDLLSEDVRIKNARTQQIREKLINFVMYRTTDFVSQVDVKTKKMYGFYDINTTEDAINFYNSYPIVEKTVDISFKNLLKNNNTEVRNLNGYFDSSKKQELLNIIVQDAKYQLLTKKCLFIDKMPSLALFYSQSALSNSQMENLFNGSKKRLFNLYESAVNIKNYKYKNDIDKIGGPAKKFQNDSADIGNPNGGVNTDVLQFLVTTPILILKGITQLMDPNISIASQIVNAAAAGLLFPKVDEQGNVSYPGDKVVLPTVLASLALLPVNVFGVPPVGFGIGPPVTPLPGMLYWALEPLLWKLPFFQNQAANSDAAKNLKNDSSNNGLKIGSTDNFSCDKDQDE